MHEGALAERPVLQGKSSADTSNARVLIIDDEAAIRDSLETLLTLEGFRVDLAVEGQSGLDAVTFGSGGIEQCAERLIVTLLSRLDQKRQNRHRFRLVRKFLDE